MTTLDALPLRQELRDRRAYGAPQIATAVKLNTNESPFPPPQALLDAIGESLRAAASDLHRYPDPDAGALRRDLAGYVSQTDGAEVSAQNIWVANGSNEVMQHVLQAFGGPGRSAMGFEPTYSMYRHLTLGTGTRWMAEQRGDDFSLNLIDARRAIVERRPDVVVIANPNSPDGGSVSLEGIETLVTAAPGIVVVDEAYVEFSAQTSATTLVERHPTKLMVSRTLSKAFGMAGIRLGYLVAHPAVVEAMRLVRLPYHLSTFTQAAARAALSHHQRMAETVRLLIAERRRVTQELTSLGFTVAPSDGNFLLFGSFPDAAAAWNRYVDRGVLLRDVGIDGHLRTAIGSPTENDAFLAASSAIRNSVPTRRPGT
ncbi:histidinol-phosphate transaminase [Streptomyces sp. 110]|uniref:Histidinol-phosphate aminotransferase n=1 Tax=Streptomyces endocoffeicus TaxID=2898945 RepID=A0ABS1QA92_9ACTN|nr:histidinol-phosphate transaminase [Streptomyces endocoffeicus]MBL1121087.1 histidinol-phosphate transaminase [Streptomyces endocoffeicus]